MKRADQPASQLPAAFERKKMPSMRLTKRTGASFVTTERPTGLKHSSPSSWMKYAPTSQRGDTLTPVCALTPAGMSSTNANPTNTSASANFAGLEGWRWPSRIQSQAKSGDSRITNAA